MGSSFDYQAMARIERFLTDYPVGHLHVVTGFASMAGLTWLARRTTNRPVTLVIGDMRTGMDQFDADDAAEAAAFMSRPDVRIINWYRTERNQRGAAIAHSKVFAVEGNEGQPVAVLAGSANLTMTGLSANMETMVEATQEDRDRAFTQVVWLERQGWDVTDRLMEKARPSPPPPPPPPGQAKTRPRETAKSGCTAAFLRIAIALAVVAALVVRMSKASAKHSMHRTSASWSLFDSVD